MCMWRIYTEHSFNNALELLKNQMIIGLTCETFKFLSARGFAPPKERKTQNRNGTPYKHAEYFTANEKKVGAK